MSGEGELDLGGEDPQLPGRRVIDEHRLAEAELGCHALALPGRYLAALEEDAETIAPLPVLVGEDPQDVELGHRPPRLEDRQEVLDLERGDLHPVVLPLLPLDLDETAEGVLAGGG